MTADQWAIIGIGGTWAAGAGVCGLAVAYAVAAPVVPLADRRGRA